MEDLAEHAFEMNDILIKSLRLTPIECDELWIFVKKRINSFSTNSSEKGDAGIYIAIKRHIHFFIALEVAK